MIAAVGEESSRIVAIERRRRTKVHPVRVQDLLAADHAVIEIEQAELRPVARAGQHVIGALQGASAIELQRDIAHAERIEQFAPGKGERLLRPAGQVSDNARQDLRGGAGIMKTRADRRDHLRVDRESGHVVVQIHLGRRIEA